MTIPFPDSLKLSSLIQAQFIISPDQLFSEKGAISKINYCDRFKQYKKLIIKNIDTPRMEQLITRLNTELFHVHSPNGPSSAGAQIVIDEEEEFCLAFQNEVTIGMFSLVIILRYLMAPKTRVRKVHRLSQPPTPSCPPPSQSLPTLDHPPRLPTPMSQVPRRSPTQTTPTPPPTVKANPPADPPWPRKNHPRRVKMELSCRPTRGGPPGMLAGVRKRREE